MTLREKLGSTTFNSRVSDIHEAIDANDEKQLRKELAEMKRYVKSIERILDGKQQYPNF